MLTFELDGESRQIAAGDLTWVSWADSQALLEAGAAVDIGDCGGWVDESVDWAEYIAAFRVEYRSAYETVRSAILKGGLRFGGFKHQGSAWDGAGRVPVLVRVVDGVEQLCVMQNSMRAHGDLMAAVWNQHHIDAGEATRFSYCHFAWTSPKTSGSLK